MIFVNYDCYLKCRDVRKKFSSNRVYSLRLSNCIEEIDQCALEMKKHESSRDGTYQNY